MSWKFRRGGRLWKIGVGNLATSSTQRGLQYLGGGTYLGLHSDSVAYLLCDLDQALQPGSFRVSVCAVGMLTPTSWALCGDRVRHVKSVQSDRPVTASLMVPLESGGPSEAMREESWFREGRNYSGTTR